MTDDKQRMSVLLYLMKEDFQSLYRLMDRAYQSQKINLGNFDIDGLPVPAFVSAIRMKIISLQCNQSYVELISQLDVKVGWHSLLNCLPFLEERRNYAIIESNMGHLEGIIDKLEECATEKVYKYLN